MIEPILCTKCNRQLPEDGYAARLCQPCRSELLKRPFPLWIKAVFTAVLFLFILACSSISESFDARLSFERGLNAEHQGNYKQAIREYEQVRLQYPDSTKLLVRQAVAYYKAGAFEQAIDVSKQLQGRKVDKNTAAEINGIISQLSSIQPKK